MRNIQENTGNKRNQILDDLVAQIQNEKIKSYVTGRVMPQMEWYSRKGADCKKRYYHWKTATIFFGALIPVVSTFADGSVIMKAQLAALGSIITACNAYITLSNYKELWLTYRNSREKLYHVLLCYFNDAGVFDLDSTQDVKDKLLVNICENEICGENSDWITFMKK